MIFRSKCVIVAACGSIGFSAALSAQAAGARDTTASDSTVLLAPIQVTVTRRVAPLRDVPYAISTLQGDVIRQGRATTGLDESLVEMSGVYVANRYNPSLDEKVSIRGFGSRSAFGVRGVKILLDGIPQTLPDGQGQLSNVDLSNVGSVEVLRGSASSLYGNASGGVINFQSIRPSRLGPSLTGRVVGGSYGLVKWGVDGSIPVGNGVIALGFARTQSDGWRNHSVGEKRQLRFRFDQELGERTTLLVAAHYANDPQLDNPGSLNETELQEDPQQANPRNEAANAGKAIQQGQVGVTLAHRFSNEAELKVTAFGLSRDLDNPLSFAYITLDRRALGLRASVMTPFRLGSLAPWVMAGIDIQGQRDDRLNRTPDSATVTRDQLERVSEVGPFVQVATDFGSKFTLNLSARFDWVSFDAEDRLLSDGDASGSRTMSSPSGSVGGTYRVSQGFQPYANVGTSFETPTTTELVNKPTGGGGLNDQLEPQKATTVEVGARGTVAQTVTYSVTLFTAFIQDALIPFEVPSEPGRRFFRNAGSSRHTGGEVELTLGSFRGFTLTSAYTLADYTFVDFSTADDTFDDNTIPGVPRHHLFASLLYESPFGLWLALDNTTASEVYADDANSAFAPSWYVMNVRAGVDVPLGNWRLRPFAAVLNLLDESYVSSVTTNAGFGRYWDPAPPRNGYLGIEIGPRRR